MSKYNEVENLPPPEIRQMANIARGAVLPDKSSIRYEQAYDKFPALAKYEKCSRNFLRRCFLGVLSRNAREVLPDHPVVNVFDAAKYS